MSTREKKRLLIYIWVAVGLFLALPTLIWGLFVILTLISGT